VWEVAVYRHLPDEAIRQRPASWLFAEYERVAEAQWRQVTVQVMAVETGVGRALAQALGGKSPPDLPDYDDLVARASSRKDRLPAWQRAYERANPGRARQTPE
jgi:hypothetical protein